MATGAAAERRGQPTISRRKSPTSQARPSLRITSLDAGGAAAATRHAGAAAAHPS